MNILYCRIGWMNSYRGNATEKPIGGGKYNKDNIGHEVYNYLGYNGKYYGFVEAGLYKNEQNSIHVKKFYNDKKAESATGILVVWVARKPTGSQYIVGWYCNSTVFRELQAVPDEVMSIRDLKEYSSYNVYSEQVFLVPARERVFRIEGMGRNNIWYGKNDTNAKVLEYIQNYDNKYKARIETIERGIEQIEGKEKEAVVKIRVNQDVFRRGLLEKFNQKCCLCGVDEEKMLIASHIKPWSASDEHEKLDLANGLLLCPNHDRLFDQSLISFDESGKIVISEKLSENSRKILNISEEMSISISEDNKEYIRYHREKFIRDSEPC